MSVRTRADLILDQADRDLARVIANLQPIVARDPDVWGSDGYSLEYWSTLVDVLSDLLKARGKLDR